MTRQQKMYAVSFLGFVLSFYPLQYEMEDDDVIDAMVEQTGGM